MKRILWSALVLLCLLIPASLPAADNNGGDQEEMSEMQMTLNKYKEEGYDLLGPVQYLEKSSERITFYRHSPVAYRILDTIDEAGDRCSLKKHDFVFVLSKHGHVVLIRVDREDHDNV